MFMLQRAETPVALLGVEATRSFFAPCFAHAICEQLWVAHVDSEARCIHLAKYGEGIDVVDLPMRAIIGDAIRFESAGILLAHNHLSGDPTPSRADKMATRSLALAGEAIDLTIVDHLVFAGGACSDFRRLGLI